MELEASQNPIEQMNKGVCPKAENDTQANNSQMLFKRFHVASITSLVLGVSL